MSSAFIPVYAEVSRGRGAKRRRAPSSAGRSGPSPSCSPASPWPGSLLSPWLVDLLAHEFRASPWQFALTVSLNRWIFPYIFLVSLAALCQAVLNAHGRFAVSAAAPIFMNVAIHPRDAPARAAPARSRPTASPPACSSAASCRSPSSCRSCAASGRRAAGSSAGATRTCAQVLLLMTPRLFAYGINTINLTFATRFAAGLGHVERLAPLLREPAEGARPRRLRRRARDRDPAAPVAAGALGGPRGLQGPRSPSHCG